MLAVSRAAMMVAVKAVMMVERMVV
jgi:hypothetical protein